MCGSSNWKLGMLGKEASPERGTLSMTGSGSQHSNPPNPKAGSLYTTTYGGTVYEIARGHGYMIARTWIWIFLRRPTVISTPHGPAA